MDGLDDSPLDNPRNIRILTIHGSESFRLVRFENERESMSVGAIINEQLFPRSGKNKRFTYRGEVGPYVIAPSFRKQFMVDLQFLLVEAIRCAERARNLIVIGCGLRPEDNYLSLVVSSFMNSKELEKKRIFIVSPNASDAKRRLRNSGAEKPGAEKPALKRSSSRLIRVLNLEFPASTTRCKMRRSNKGHRDGAVQAAFETAPRVWVCV